VQRLLAFTIYYNICLQYVVDDMDLLSNIDESQWKNEEPKNIKGTQ